jgi:hypothetical protein
MHPWPKKVTDGREWVIGGEKGPSLGEETQGLAGWLV